MLFQDRLKGQIFFPVGMEWYPEFWKLQPYEATARQFLEVGSIPSDGTTPLNSPDNLSHRITLEEFKNTKFDIIIASVPQHVEPFIKLRDLYQPSAKICFQVGNSWGFDESFPIKNILASAKIPKLSSSFHVVEYHEEFSLRIFNYSPPPGNKKIYSFINCLREKPADWELFLELERLMPDWEFKSFGGQNRDGWCTGDQEVADKMREADYIYQVKSGGDGMGMVIHQAAAMGKPLITRASDYDGKLAFPLTLSDSSIRVDNHTPEEIADEIEATFKAGGVNTLSKNIYKRFKELVDFGQEEIEVSHFLANLV